MNDLALELGYAGRTEAKTLAEQNIDKIARGIEYTCKLLIEKLGNDKESKEKIEKTIKKLIKKYNKQIQSGEYRIITNDMLVVIGKGTIVDEECGIIVWTREQFLNWDEMTEI